MYRNVFKYNFLTFFITLKRVNFREVDNGMKKFLFSVLMLSFVGLGFCADPIYTGSVEVLTTPLGSGDALTIYGFIDHTTGQGTLAESSLQLRYYKVGSDPEVSSTYLSESSIEYLSNYENPDNLLLDGAYYAERAVSGLANGTYTVQLLLNGKILDAAQFNYDSSLQRNSNLRVSSVFTSAGSLTADYVIEKENTPENVTYSVGFYTPSINGLGNADSTDSLFVGLDNSTATSVTFTSPLIQGANLFVVKVLSTTPSSPDLMPAGFVKLWMGGSPEAISVKGTLTFADCTAKEEQTKDGTFTVKNTGDYPASYTVNAESGLETSISFTTSLIQPGNSADGTISLTAVEGDSPSKLLTIKLIHGSATLSTVSKMITVQARDLTHEISILSYKITPSNIMEGDEVIVSFTLKNTGDFDERVRVEYSSGDETITGNSFSLNIGDSRTKTITFEAPVGADEVPFTLNILSEDGSLIAGKVTTIYVEQLSFTPYVRWYNKFEQVQQGNNTDNKLTIKNKGNTADWFNVKISSNYASLDKDYYLGAEQSASITVPVVIVDNSKTGAYAVTATMCSLTTSDCASDDFTLTVLGKNYENSTIVLNQTMQELSGNEGAVFEVLVKNFEGATTTYTLSTGSFNGELQISPSSITLLNGEDGKFYVYAKPENKIDEVLTYQVLANGGVVDRGNLTMSYGPGGLTGLITLSEAGSVGALVLSVALIGALVFLGIRAFNQSRVELKYWK